MDHENHEMTMNFVGQNEWEPCITKSEAPRCKHYSAPIGKLASFKLTIDSVSLSTVSYTGFAHLEGGYCPPLHSVGNKRW